MRHPTLQPLIDEIHKLRRAITRSPRFVWATVTGTTPLRIRVDGDSTPMAGTPATTIAGLTVGRRVYCVLQNGRCTVIGAAQ